MCEALEYREFQSSSLEGRSGLPISGLRAVPALGIARQIAINTAAHSPEFLGTLDKLGQELAYMDQPEFAKFWTADARKIEDAINSIGRVQG